MSNNQTNKNNNFPQPTKVVEVGKFYFIHDRSSSGHPGLIVSKNDEKNRYLVVRFDSDKVGNPTKLQKGTKHITLLKYPISSLIVNSYLRNRPFLCKRKDIGHLMPDLKLHKDDINTIKLVSSRNPELSSSLKNK